MTGTIKTFVEEKGYGFIKGDDGKDYFFHENNVNKKEAICDGSLVDFETKATPKGYSAVKIKIQTTNKSTKYIVPDEVYTSKDRGVKGWETVETSDWTISGESRDSPDEAKEILLNRAHKIGANAVIQMTYYKTTGSETSDSGRGTYKFTLHNFKGRAVNIGKKNAKGTKTISDLTSLNEKCPKIKEVLKEKTASSSMKVMMTWIAIIIFGAIIAMIASGTENKGLLGLIAFPVVIALFFVRSVNYDYWLEKIK